MSNTFNSLTPTFGNFLDLDTMVKPWLRMDPSDTTFDFQLQLICNAICQDVQRHIGKPIAPMTYGPDDGLGKFDGGAGMYSSEIILPRVPVLKVVSVIEYAGQSPTTLTEITNPQGINGLSDGYIVSYRTGRITRILGGMWNRPWLPGTGNIWVTWIAGYNPIPEDILMACLRWAAQRFRSEFQKPMTSMPSGPSFGGGGGSSEESSVDAEYIGMPHYVEEVLEDFIEPSIPG